MSVKVFLELVEAKAKIASVWPFFMGLFFAYYVYGQVNWPLAITFFVAMLLFNMSVDAHDNYEDYQGATEAAAEWKQKTNIIGVHNLSLKLIRNLILVMAGSATILGILMVIETGWPLLVMGVFCFLVGYFYAAGPLPISQTPFGEVFSGLTMGFVITLISVYINTFPVEAITWSLFWRVLLASGIAVFAISNIMLANNLCDADEDRTLNRKTIVYYFGKPVMIKVFAFNVVAGYLCLIASVFLNLLPYTSLLVLFSAPIVYRNTRAFMAKQVKKETFKFAVQNALVEALFCIVLIGIGTIFNW
ncbi:1,4-dihydroxy-2-naphthoate octaprenyltransferase [Secundilactobacillus odoratitofui DSM 19909 = JCM 15043]|uniref:1,4-dihydroxy-2-naphthoate octaprenyltransferase n=1 Tax=Secundilactobacillus odoratitofui DSM 19909 = JCM 15043 TaxID=1423776 RepID=A0A0R1LMQ4_9LACO|nr:1,4-dihydroxy-2-naphthoate polyprenyltransferase [Secundilactobacillus odoratitofui]KRK97182.1 1,4-dihydroxy-2-naphthoate octaprenyltransferase [Secundilactobacillus odoratitofui DSM 19909 = JCM 15043]